MDGNDTSRESDGLGAPPAHVAIIMDGNGRWAKQRGFPRAEGHRRGVEAVRRTVDAAPGLGIKVLTLFSFSSENWNRPATEVDDLMGLIKRFIRTDLKRLHANNVRVRVIGGTDRVESGLVEMIREAETLTAANTALDLVIAFNYGARAEITHAVRQIAQQVHDGVLDVAAIDEETVSNALYTSGIPDPELLLRTSGEVRLSNFLLWQCAYTEFVFVNVFWPEFDRAQLEDAINIYRRRQRRFGGL
ncbi:MAG: isoprenyl transferase [Hyphomicrobiaceae bacterium]